MDWASRFRRTADERPEAPATPADAVRYLLEGNAAFVREAAPDVPAPTTAGPADRHAAVALDAVWGPGVAGDPGYRDALVETAVFLNAAMTAYHLRSELRPEERHGVEVVYGVFDVATCRVIGPDLDPATDDTSKLAPAPADPGELTALGRVIAGYPAVARHLTATRRRGTPHA